MTPSIMLAPTMTCSLCEPIGDQQIANTGRGYYLGQPADSLTSLGPSDDNELRVCPTCGDFFHYTSEQAQTGSGNNDDDTITRLPPEASRALGAARANRLPLPGLAAALAAIPDGPARTLGPAILEDTQRRALVPHILDLLARGGDPWVGSIVRGVADRDADYVKRQLASRPDVPALAALRTHAAVAGCSICRGIRYWPPVPPPPALKRAENNLFDCPECASVFHVEGNKGEIVRVNPLYAAKYGR